MKILSLTKKKKHLTEILFEDGSLVSVDSELVEINKLSPGTEVSDTGKLLYESDYKRAKSRALWYLSRSDHSKKALTDKLKKGGFSAQASEDACLRMEELGLIDDLIYAKRVAEYLSVSGSSKREIAYKLSLKGISSDIIKDILETEESDEREKIKRLIESKYRNKLSNEKDIQKVFAALIRKGFSYSDVKNALKAYSEELENCEEF